MMQQVKNAVYTSDTRSTITGDWLHPEFGWVPYTAARGDSVVMDAVFDAFLALPPAPYEPPPPPTPDEVRMLRREAYAAESDPLYLEFQYDQSPAAERRWRDKVADIKARYPLPDGTYQKEDV